MSDKYEKNGYNTSGGGGGGDFKRNSCSNDMEVSVMSPGVPGMEIQAAEMNEPSSERVGEYMRELLAEKVKLDQGNFPICTKLIDQEIQKVQALGRVPPRDMRYVDIYREKPIKVTVKVRVPVKEHPKFNFVGKLLGPKGISMKRLQEETMCKMAVLGRGSMKDKQKEEELRLALDPKYAHLSDDLHVEITALGPPAEAHARIAYALAEVRKYLIPDNNDLISQEQIREMMEMCPAQPSPPMEGGSGRGRGRGMFRPPMSRGGGMSRGLSSSRAPVPTPRVMPAKTKIMSILDRARAAMEETYGAIDDDQYHQSSHHYSIGYDEPPGHHHDSYYDGPQSSGSVSESYYAGGSRHHEHEYGGSTTSSHHHHRSYKGMSGRSDSHSGARRMTSITREARYRSSPYTRPPK